MIHHPAMSVLGGSAGGFRTMRLRPVFAKFVLLNPCFAFLNAGCLSGHLHVGSAGTGLNPSLKTVADLQIVGLILAWHATSIERDAQPKRSCRRVRPTRDMINKICSTAQDAVRDVADGATIAIGGFGGAGMPNELIDALIEQGAKDLVVVSNNAGNGDFGLAALLRERRVRKLICSFPRQKDAYAFEALYRAGQIELEVVPQGTLAERLRAAGCGIGAFYTPTGFGTMLAENKETRRIDERDFVLEYPIHVDFSLVNAKSADRWGNLIYNKTARNFAPVMAMAAKTTVAAVAQVCALGELDPETIVTPGIFVNRVVLRGGSRTH